MVVDPDVDVTFGPHDVFRPDVSGWRKDKVAEFPSERPGTHRPDWICEGLSPGSAAFNQGEKRAVYERAEVPWYWLLDPQNRTLTVLRFSAEGYVMERVVGDTGLVRLPPFDSVEIELAEIFPPSGKTT